VPTAAYKRCFNCRAEKRLEEFHRNRNKPIGRTNQCKTCKREYDARYYSNEEARARSLERVRLWKAANPERIRQNRIQREYGLTPEEQEEFFARNCEICGGRGVGREELHVDHCHETGKVRGALCGPCNRGIGSLGDDPERVRAALAYLERHQ
jgi:hypothetical protein